MLSGDWLIPFSNPPASTILILGICLIMSLAVTLVNKSLTNKEQLIAWNREIAALKEDLEKAKRSGDKKLLAKAQRRQSMVMKIQGKMFRQQMKTTAVFFVPFLLIWMFLTGRILVWQLFETPFTHGNIVAFLPWLGHNPYKMDYFMWYILCSFLFSTLFSRLFGTAMGATQ